MTRTTDAVHCDAENARRERLRSAFRFFDAQWMATWQGDADFRGLALVHPQDFLDLAAPVSKRIASEGRSEPVEAVLDAGGVFSTPIELIFEIDGGSAQVIDHDGRHRAMALAARGVAAVPVLLLPHRYPWAPPVTEDDLQAIEEFVPEPHSDEDDYDMDASDLRSRDVPLDAVDVLGDRFSVAEALEILGVAGPAPGLGR